MALEPCVLVLVKFTLALLPAAALTVNVPGALTGDTPDAAMVKAAVGPVVCCGLTVSVNPCDAVRCGLLLSWTPTVRLNVPVAVGVPESTPLVGFMDRPLGWPETDQVYGGAPPEAVIAAAVYAVPSVAIAGLSPVLVIDSATTAGFTVSGNAFEIVCCGLLLS